MRLPRFDYLGPDNLEGALDLLATHRGDAKILAGGTDLLVRMKKGLLNPKFLISLKALSELSYIKKEDNNIKIGAGTSIAAIIASDLIKKESRALLQACEKIGAITIQHFRGTIGGNIPRTTGAITTTNPISTGPDVSPVTRMAAKSVMHEKNQTGATPPASLMVLLPLWP